MVTIMTIEEKAKRYDEAINVAKDSFNYPDFPGFIRADVVFPELAESEDERIRKALVEMVHDTTGDSLWIDYNVHKEDAIAWLEKQGKQKPTWSEEDETMLCYIEGHLEYLKNDKGYSSSEDQIMLKRQLEWLKSLKDRYTWKPTTEQLRELRCVISGCSFETSILVELEENLKKLL